MFHNQELRSLGGHSLPLHTAQNSEQPTSWSTDESLFTVQSNPCQGQIIQKNEILNENRAIMFWIARSVQDGKCSVLLVDLFFNGHRDVDIWGLSTVEPPVVTMGFLSLVRSPRTSLFTEGQVATCQEDYGVSCVFAMPANTFSYQEKRL